MSRRPVLVCYGDGRLLIGIDRFVPFRLTETGRLLPVVGGMDSHGDMGIVAAGADQSGIHIEADGVLVLLRLAHQR